MTVCPNCVQWRCKEHGFNDDDCICDADEFEPVWADGTVARLTQETPCAPCAEAVAAYEAESRECQL